MEAAVAAQHLPSRTTAPGERGIVTRIAVRELENWYFGDWPAVRAAYSRVPATPPKRYRVNPDSAVTKTSDELGRILRAAGVRVRSKPAWAERIGPHLDPDRNTSPSFRTFVSAVREAAR